MQNDLNDEKAQIFSANQRNLNGKCLDADELEIFSAFFLFNLHIKANNIATWKVQVAQLTLAVHLDFYGLLISYFHRIQKDCSENIFSLA